MSDDRLTESGEAWALETSFADARMFEPQPTRPAPLLFHHYEEAASLARFRKDAKPVRVRYEITEMKED